KSRGILEFLAKDLPTAKHWVAHTPGAPLHFPDAEWANILQGHAINLHNILSSLHVL
ncbi:hypothetical protein P691DRAFT_683734, partial [Macrolepiota fuliginosa MF-IS2]